jgi:hypothetical protein
MALSGLMWLRTETSSYSSEDDYELADSIKLGEILD